MYHYLHFFNLSFFINLTLWTLHFSQMCTWVSLENENSYAKFLFISRLCLRGKCIFSEGQPIVSFPLLLSTFSSTTPSEEVVFWSFCKRLRRQRGKRGFWKLLPLDFLTLEFPKPDCWFSRLAATHFLVNYLLEFVVMWRRQLLRNNNVA